MRWTQTLIPTMKEEPADAEVPSHRLMLRAGLIRQLMAGAYTYLPLGYRVLRKAEAIVREEMDRAGAIEVFINEETIETLEAIMAQQGYLDGREMGRTFRMLRSNSLIWHYYVHSYLYGEKPAAFDVLYWNIDTTRMPRAMHSYYLREFYLHNKLVKKDALTLAGHPIDLGAVRQPLYAVGCEEDHIAPWKACYKIAGRIDAPVRHTLSSSGHILGIINPPVSPPKRWWLSDSA